MIMTRDSLIQHRTGSPLLALSICILLLGACSSGGGGDDAGSSAAADRRGFDTSSCTIDASLLFDGGPGRDGIPAILNPEYALLDEILASNFPYQPEDLVLVVELNGERRAYPERILWQHEIINDVLGGENIVVSYCPLTGSAIVFDRAANEDFRVSGLLFESNLVMYDSATDSLWPQMDFAASCGSRRGQSLNMKKVQEMTFARLQEFYPNIETVIDASRTAFGYTNYPYGTYDQLANETLLFEVSELDTTYPIKSLVAMVPGANNWRGYPHQELAQVEVANDSFDSRELVALYDDAGRFAAIYNRTLDGQTLTFSSVANDIEGQVGSFLMRDTETGSTWNQLGQAVAGPMAGMQLQDELNMNAMWFSYRVSLPNASTYTAN